ncbi:hypothetical protein T484DRAFT_1757517 [Baffinella frigidus]|nr:hypothetical protein T484DRAFT_1757517 [Cryptophyta sp. CCMP2293]
MTTFKPLLTALGFAVVITITLAQPSLPIKPLQSGGAKPRTPPNAIDNGIKAPTPSPIDTLPISPPSTPVAVKDRVGPSRDKKKEKKMTPPSTADGTNTDTTGSTKTKEPVKEPSVLRPGDNVPTITEPVIAKDPLPITTPDSKTPNQYLGPNSTKISENMLEKSYPKPSTEAIKRLQDALDEFTGSFGGIHG